MDSTAETCPALNYIGLKKNYYSSICSLSMESQLWIGWQQEKAELEQEVCRLLEKLAESRAEKEELEARSRALQERVRRSWSRDLHCQSKLTSLLSSALSVWLTHAQPASGGGAEGVEEAGKGGEREGGKTSTAHPPTAEQGACVVNANLVPSSRCLHWYRCEAFRFQWPVVAAWMPQNCQRLAKSVICHAVNH